MEVLFTQTWTTFVAKSSSITKLLAVPIWSLDWKYNPQPKAGPEIVRKTFSLSAPKIFHIDLTVINSPLLSYNTSPRFQLDAVPIFLCILNVEVLNLKTRICTFPYRFVIVINVDLFYQIRSHVPYSSLHLYSPKLTGILFVTWSGHTTGTGGTKFSS